MRATYEAVQPNSASSFTVRTFREEAFAAPYHHHPEYELTLILAGDGKRYVGSHLAPYAPGDLVLLGPNVPHCWKSEPGPRGEIRAVSVVSHFTHEFLGDSFFDKTELRPVAQLLLRSAGGLQFSGPAGARRAIRELGQEPDALRRLLLLLSILQELAATTDYRVLDPNHRAYPTAPPERERCHRVMAYLVEHFREDITLAQVADVANLSPSAFCKYFKNITRRTFGQTVLDYRLQYATQQLVQTSRPAADICYDSGFRDVPYFNRVFKARHGQSPLHYRQQFRPLEPEWLPGATASPA